MIQSDRSLLRSHRFSPSSHNIVSLFLFFYFFSCRVILIACSVGNPPTTAHAFQCCFIYIHPIFFLCVSPFFAEGNKKTEDLPLSSAVFRTHTQIIRGTKKKCPEEGGMRWKDAEGEKFARALDTERRSNRWYARGSLGCARRSEGGSAVVLQHATPLTNPPPPPALL